jgi:nucleotidyltransferase/DNA polymerase involved in DNA repair
MARQVDTLGRVLTEREDEVHRSNILKATAFNMDVLVRLYGDIITRRFEEGEASERTLRDYQSDFKMLMESYGSDSIRVATQLKTFNQFLMLHKAEYAENLEKELQASKRKYTNEKEELKDRL